jgi:hypothetical protein
MLHRRYRAAGIERQHALNGGIEHLVAIAIGQCIRDCRKQARQRLRYAPDDAAGNLLERGRQLPRQRRKIAIDPLQGFLLGAGEIDAERLLIGQVLRRGGDDRAVHGCHGRLHFACSIDAMLHARQRRGGVLQPLLRVGKAERQSRAWRLRSRLLRMA